MLQMASQQLTESDAQTIPNNSANNPIKCNPGLNCLQLDLLPMDKQQVELGAYQPYTEEFGAQTSWGNPNNPTEQPTS